MEIQLDIFKQNIFILIKSKILGTFFTTVLLHLTLDI